MNLEHLLGIGLFLWWHIQVAYLGWYCVTKAESPLVKHLPVYRRVRSDEIVTVGYYILLGVGMAAIGVLLFLITGWKISGWLFLIGFFVQLVGFFLLLVKGNI